MKNNYPNIRNVYLITNTKNFTKSELDKFRSWFNNFDSDEWDKDIEKDIQSSKLQGLADKAISDFQSGKASKFSIIN